VICGYCKWVEKNIPWLLSRQSTRERQRERERSRNNDRECRLERGGESRGDAGTVTLFGNIQLHTGLEGKGQRESEGTGGSRRNQQPLPKRKEEAEQLLETERWAVGNRVWGEGGGAGADILIQL